MPLPLSALSEADASPTHVGTGEEDTCGSSQAFMHWTAGVELTQALPHACQI